MKIKGFDENLCCRGMQFEVGKEYKIENDKELMLCTDTVFHYCDSLQQVDKYYDCGIKSKNRFCEIEVLGEEITDGNKCGSNHIRIIREITGKELDTLRGLTDGNTGIFNTGSCNSGKYNLGSHNTGHYNLGNWNVGDHNSGDSNLGNCNSGWCNLGNCNLNWRNSGDWNTGGFNTGDCNAGNYNTGDCNIGSFNSGDWNESSYNNGFFNTIEPTVFIFNKDSGMTAREFKNSEYYFALTSVSFRLTEWEEYTEEEKKKNPQITLNGGRLRKYPYKVACANWWKRLTEENKEIIMQIPNFDKEIFKEITGIDVDKWKENKFKRKGE